MSNSIIKKIPKVRGQLTLDEYIQDKTVALAREYIDRHGFKPTKKQMTMWMKLLKQAYNKGMVLDLKVRNE